jgi:hypothetical protein
MTVVYTHFAGNAAHEKAAKDVVRRSADCVRAASELFAKGGSALDTPFAKWFGTTVDPGPVMSLDTFKTGTSRTFSLRNGELGDIDTALKHYHDPKKDRTQATAALELAVATFINAKNVKHAGKGGFDASKRESKSNAVSRLWAQVRRAQQQIANPLGTGKYGEVSAKINRMLYYINELPMTVRYAAYTLPASTNAEASHMSGEATKSYQGREASGAHAGVMIKLPRRFFEDMSRTQSNDQTQIETFIHELSHVAAGTKDMERADHTTNPQPCYGRVNALALAQNFPDQAQDNAENYGFFIVEVGGETPVFSQPAAQGSGKKWATVQGATLIR